MSQSLKRIKSVLKEVKFTIQKSCEDIAKYYNWYWTSAPVFKPSDKVFLDFLDIQTTCLSAKLLHYCFGLYVVEKWVGPMLYHLKLLPALWWLHPVFHVIKLTTTPEDSMSERYSELLSDSIIINEKKE